MITGTNSSVVRNAYSTSSTQGVKASSQTKETVITHQGDKSRLDHLKEAIGSGEYKLNLNKLSEMLADELVS